MIKVLKWVFFSVIFFLNIETVYSQAYNFSIESPFWFQAWFWLLALIFGSLIVFGLIRSHYRKVECDRLSDLVDERTSHLSNAIKEKEVLVKEIHHRVKNNLAMIIGLLELQASNSTDEKTVNTLRDSILRIYSMSLVHEKLYTNEHLTVVDVKYYVTDLINMITHSLNLDQKDIKVDLHLDDFKLSLDHGITCGLLVNELVTNAVKHAFNTHGNGNSNGLGRIDIKFLNTGNSKKLIVSDNGCGLPEKYVDIVNNQEPQNSSLGLSLIHTLTQQLDGTIDIDSNGNGTRFVISFS